MQALHIYNLLKAGKSEQAMLELELEAKEQLFDLHKQDLISLKRDKTIVQPDFKRAKPGPAKLIDAALFWKRFDERAETFGMKKIVAQSLGFPGSQNLPKSIREHRSGTVSTVYADTFASVLGQDLLVIKPQAVIIAEKGEVKEINGPIFRQRFEEYAKNFKNRSLAAQSLGIQSASHSPFRALLDKRIMSANSAYADHFAVFLGIEILGIEKEVTVEGPVVNVAYTKVPQKYKDEPIWIDCGTAKRAFSQLCDKNKLSQNAQAKAWGFNGSNQLTFFINKTGPVQTVYGKFLAETLGTEIICNPPKSHEAKENHHIKTVLQPEDFRPVKKLTSEPPKDSETFSLPNSEKRKKQDFTPAASTYKTMVSDFNLFEVSQRDLTLRARTKDFSEIPGFKFELEAFLKKNPEIFRTYPTWNEALEALGECDRRWKNRERTDLTGKAKNGDK